MTGGSSDFRDLGATVSATLREHPVGAALLGMGLVWLVTSRTGAPEAVARAVNAAGDAVSSGGERIRKAARQAGETLADKADEARALVEEKADVASQGLHEAADDWVGSARGAVVRATEEAAKLRDRGLDYVAPAASELRAAGERSAAVVTDQGRALRGRVADALDKQPLLLAAGALAIGAVIAATLPVAGEGKTASR